MSTYILKTNGDVPSGAYKDNQKIVGIIVSKNTNVIGIEAFKNCSNIETIEFEAGSSLERIEAWAFTGCRKINKIAFPNNEIKIDAKAFYKCDSLEKLSFGKKNIDIHYDAFPTRNQLKEVHIPAEVLDFNTGLDYLPNYISDHIDLCWLMLHCDRNKAFDSGLSLGTLLDMAIKECEELGELNQNATIEEMHTVFSKYYCTIDQKEYEPTHISGHYVDRKWIVFPTDHFYTRMANALFANWAFCKKSFRYNTIALLIDRNKEYSPSDFDKVNEYANIVGYKFEILKPIGRMQLGWDNEDSPEEYDEIPGCEYEKDDKFDEVGILYEDIISGKVYAMNSDYYTWHEGLFMMIYSHFLEEMKAINPENLYEADYKIRSNDIEFKDIEYLQIYRTNQEM